VSAREVDMKDVGAVTVSTALARARAVQATASQALTRRDRGTRDVDRPFDRAMNSRTDRLMRGLELHLGEPFRAWIIT
jgi:hypothetical protein